jgi:hypothetical protein
VARTAPFRVFLTVFVFLLTAVVGGAIVLHNHDRVVGGADVQAHQGG